MVVGDGLGKALEDQMGGDVGVEASAVVVITLLAVLGNAMVVATLIRRSLLHHPSNRLVLSLTGSNLILAVVVLPGMVMSLLITPASPSHQHPPLSHHVNVSTKVPSQDYVKSKHISKTHGAFSSFLNLHNASVILPQHLNNSSLPLKTHKGPSKISQHGTNSSISPESDNRDSMTFSPFNDDNLKVTPPVPEYLTTDVPLYLEVSSTSVGPSMPIYSHRDISFLSQNLEDSQVAAWHHSIVSSQNQQHSDLDWTLRGVPLSISNAHQHIRPLVTDHPEQSGDESDLIEMNGDGEDGELKTEKEIRSVSMLNHKMKSFGERGYSDHIQESGAAAGFSGHISQIDLQPEANHHHSKRNRERRIIAHEDVDLKSGVGETDSNKPHQGDVGHKNDYVLESSEGFDPPKGPLWHTPNRRRKLGTRHYHHHRKQRLGRNREEPNDSQSHILRQNESRHISHLKLLNLDEDEYIDETEPERWEVRELSDENALRKEEDIQLTKEKRSKREHSGSSQGHIKENVQVRIKHKRGGREQIILVHSVLEIEEEREKQVMPVSAQGGQHKQHQEQQQQHHLHLNAKVNVKDVHQSDLASPGSPKGSKRGGAKDHLSDQLPQHMFLNLESAQDLKDLGDKQKSNHTSLSKMMGGGDFRREDKLPLPPAQRQHMANLGVDMSLQKQESHAKEKKQQEVRELPQLYGVVDWESDRWEGGKILCQGAAFFTNLVTAVSSLTVAVIAIDRYLAIVRPLVYGVMVTSWRCHLILIWCWSQALLTALPPLFGWSRYERHEPHGRCGVAWGASPSYAAVWTISVFLVPFSIMVVCYYHILQVARNKCKRIRVGKVSETSPPNTPDPASACLEGFPFPLSVAHLTSPPVGGRPASPLTTNSALGKLGSFGNLSGAALGNQDCHLHENNAFRQWSEPGPPLVRRIGSNEGLDSPSQRAVPCRSYSVSAMLRAIDSTTNTNDPTIKPKRKLGDFGRSCSLCQVPQQPPRPCLRRVQSTFSVRHTLKKLSLATRRPSWNWEGSPSKGFWTVFVVMGAHLITWGPYTCMAIAEAILVREQLPCWVTVTCTLLLFTASVFYPIVYGLYNRNIRKELLACLCPTWARRRGSHVRRPSTLPSYSGSILDFTSLRQRSVLEKPELCHSHGNGITGTIATISSTVGSIACPAPLMIMADDDSLPTRGYNLNLRKPSQDSGTVMIGGDDQDSDVEMSAPTSRQQTTRRVSAPSVLSTVREDPHSTVVDIEAVPKVSRHFTINCRNLPLPQRKIAILPLSVQLLSTSSLLQSSLRRSRSLDKINSCDKETTLDNAIMYRSLRRKRTVPLVRETQFNAPPMCDRVPRRRGSVAVMKVSAIPEDCGVAEYPEMTDSGRGSVDSGNLSKPRLVSGRGSVDGTELIKSSSLHCRGSNDGNELAKFQVFNRRGSVDSTEFALARTKREEIRNCADPGKNPATRQVSVDEGIGGDCLPEKTNWE